jgi:hypothetical protein
MQRDSYLINPGADFEYVQLLGNGMQRDPQFIDIAITPYVSLPTPKAEAGLSAVQEATVEYLLSTLEGVDTVEFLRTTGGPDEEYTNVKSLSVTSKSGSWADTGLDAFTTYYYALKSANSNGEESLGRSKEREVQTGSGNAVNLRTITVQNSDANGYELIVDAQSNNGGLEYNLDGGTWQSSNTFSVQEGNTYTIGIRDASGAQTSMDVTVPTLSVGESEVLFENKTPEAPTAKVKTFDGSAGEAIFHVESAEIDIEALEVHRKADSESSYSLIEKVSYPLLPSDYTDNNYDESKGHIYKARVTDVAGQTGPFSDVIKPSFFEDFEGDLSEWTVNYSPFELKTDRVYEGAQAAGANSTNTLPSSSLAIERQMESYLEKPSKASWYWNEDSSQYGSAFHFINSNGNLEVALGTQNPQWQAWDGTGMNDQIWGANGYDRWIYYEITFDWSNGTYDYYMEDLQTGDTRSGTRQLKHGVDVAKIGLGEKPGATARHYTWWDNITIK